MTEKADIEAVRAFQSRVCVIVADFRRLCVLVAVLAAASLRGRMKLEGRVCDVSMAHTLFFSYLFSPILAGTG